MMRRTAILLSLASCVIAGIFELPPLPYEYNALEPHFDEQTMRIHHGKHHATYVAGLNAALEGEGDSMKGDAMSLANLQKSAPAKSVAMRNHGGGHYNHALFWVNLAPASGPSTEPFEDLAAAIDDKFGNLEGLKASFEKAALGRFGSGWVWLGVTPDGSLAVTSTANQDNPLMEGLTYDFVKMIPILGLDVWEHAYYLKYQNRRADYVKAFWNVVNWMKVSRNYDVYARQGKAVPPTTTGGGHATEL
eukprot:TRINITY_DN6494_c1_g2_i1.p1 TRINITY_DN6494_c1_g2~~TRINITY_DN6494_c1_g2_i1.p1  ORF type:complete len:248 (-),score=34.17 TRINITY_DN6494_c1_g2_i1:157-900(-)